MLVTDTYREKQAKFRNTLLKEEKKVSASARYCTRLCPTAHAPHRATVTNQKRFSSRFCKTTLCGCESRQPFSRSPSASGVRLKVGLGMLVSLVVNLDPRAADMAARAIWDPNHVLSGVCSVTRLRSLFEIKIELSGLIRFGARVRN
jgi:hypothetical protein